MKKRVMHFANHDMVLDVIWESPNGAIPQGGVPAVARRGKRPVYFAGEIVGDELVAVDMFGDESTARRNAERRDWRQR